MAMSGVAATLIDGEVIHSAAKLNCKNIHLIIRRNGTIHEC